MGHVSWAQGQVFMRGEKEKPASRRGVSCLLFFSRCTQTSTTTPYNVSNSFDHCFLREDQTSGHAALNTTHLYIRHPSSPSQWRHWCVGTYSRCYRLGKSFGVLHGSHTQARFQDPDRYHRAREPTSTHAYGSSKQRHESGSQAETEMIPSNLQRPKTTPRHPRLRAATPETQKHSRPITAKLLIHSRKANYYI